MVLELRDRGLHDLRPLGGEHRVLPRMGREARARPANQAGDLLEAVGELLPPREPVHRMRPERDEVRGDAEDLDAVLLVPAQDRLERVEVRGDQLTQTRRRRVARRTVRAEDGSPVLTHAYPSRRPPSWTGAFVERAEPGTASARAE